MFKTLSAVAASAFIIAAAFTVFESDVKASIVQSAKSDRADSVDCDRQGWPYYQHGCIRDESRNAGRAKQVRLITTDRVDIELPFHTAEPRWSGAITQQLQASLPRWAKM